MKNFVIISLIVFFLTSCGYTPIYNNNFSQNINIIIKNFEGDEYFNKKLINEIEKSTTENSDNIFQISINSTFEKKIISKDKQGKTNKFELTLNTLFIVEKDNLKKRFSFSEKSKIENKDNFFEQQKYEDIIKENFAKSIKRNFLSKLNSLSNSND